MGDIAVDMPQGLSYSARVFCLLLSSKLDLKDKKNKVKFPRQTQEIFLLYSAFLVLSKLTRLSFDLASFLHGELIWLAGGLPLRVCVCVCVRARGASC